jgi:hypothetical protein
VCEWPPKGPTLPLCHHFARAIKHKEGKQQATDCEQDLMHCSSSECPYCFQAATAFSLIRYSLAIGILTQAAKPLWLIEPAVKILSISSSISPSHRQYFMCSVGALGLPLR